MKGWAIAALIACSAKPAIAAAPDVSETLQRLLAYRSALEAIEAGDRDMIARRDRLARKSPMSAKQRAARCLEVAKTAARYPLTVELLSPLPEVATDEETLAVGVSFSAKNAFGVPGKHSAFCWFRGAELVDAHVN